MNTFELPEAKVEDPNESCPHGRHALMLIDFQNDFLADDGRMPVARGQVSAVLAATRLAVESARKAGDLIIAIGNEFRRKDYLLNLFRRGASMEGSSGARWDERLPLGQIEYLPKWATSAFVNPLLEEWLNTNRISSLTLTGLKAQACIAATAKEGIKRGFKVRILKDAVACSSDGSRASVSLSTRLRITQIGQTKVPWLLKNACSVKQESLDPTFAIRNLESSPHDVFPHTANVMNVPKFPPDSP